MQILILIDVQYSEKAVFNLEKGSNCENNSYSGSHHPVKKSSSAKLLISPLPTRPPPLNAIWKILYYHNRF